MTRDDVLKKIKDQYSENFSHLCRDLFPTLLEKPDDFYTLITSEFAPNEFLYDDIINEGVNRFKDYIFSKYDVEKEKVKVVTKTPAELLKEAGYTLYECKTEEDIQQFKKYYAPGEALCTFNGDRLRRCYVFFAVKDNVDKIKREDFKEPERQDEYGTSVISIQFAKVGNNTLSIKNRYNHTVNNPDATFSNNLDNIIEGLTDSFNEHYHFNSNTDKYTYELSGYVKANDGKYYKYNYEIYNIYYCPNNIIIDNFEVKRFDKEKYLVIDYFILDLQKNSKSIYFYDNTINDSFCSNCYEDDYIKSIKIEKDKSTKCKKITIDGNIEIVIDKFNHMIAYRNPCMKYAGNSFLTYNNSLQEIDLPNCENIGNSFLLDNKCLKSVNLEKVKEVGNSFMYSNYSALENLNLSNVEVIGDGFLLWNRSLTELNFPKVKSIGSSFLYYNDSIERIDLPNCEHIANTFLENNHAAEFINLPKVISIGDSFLSHTVKVKSVSLPNVESIGFGFLENGCKVEKVDLPKVKEVGGSFIDANEKLISINLPMVEKIGHSFLKCNKILKEVYMPNVKNIDFEFLMLNNAIESISMPNLTQVGSDFLRCDKILSSAYLPKLEIVGDSFLYFNDSLITLTLESAKQIGDNFMYLNKSLREINLPKVEEIYIDFLHNNKNIKKISFPNVSRIWDCFMYQNDSVDEVDLPNVKYIYDNFMSNNNKIKSIYLPKIKLIGSCFLRQDEALEELNIPKAESIRLVDLTKARFFPFNILNSKLIVYSMEWNHNLTNVNNIKVYNNKLFDKIAKQIYDKSVGKYRQ